MVVSRVHPAWYAISACHFDKLAAIKLGEGNMNLGMLNAKQTNSHKPSNTKVTIHGIAFSNRRLLVMTYARR
jgi:hypothetical protein